MNRRTFILTSGATAAAGSALRAAGKSANDAVNVAVIGLRGRGTNHLNAYAKVPNVNVAALCDVDDRVLTKAVAHAEELLGKRPKTETDLRRVLESKDIDAISVATPNHWHSLAGIWACQAGKDVYVEKPVSHNIREGRRLVEAARKYGRIVQAGTQGRSNSAIQSAMEFLHAGKLGRVYMARIVCYVARDSIGAGRDAAIPAGVHYDLWLGPAPFQPFNETRFHYNWHWFWNTGNGETGNNGPHLTDLARWALNKYEHPRRVQSMGALDIFQSMQETPNTQLSMMEYADGTRVQLEVRGLYTNAEQGMTKGLLVYGSEGWMQVKFTGQATWETFFGRKNEPGPKGDMKGARLGEETAHFANFVDAIRSRKSETLRAGILEGHLSTAMCHLSNIAYRVGRQVVFDSATETFPGDEAAYAMLSREYRYPYVVPEKL
jgi:predicted dehydrogenase